MCSQLSQLIISQKSFVRLLFDKLLIKCFLPESELADATGILVVLCVYLSIRRVCGQLERKRVETERMSFCVSAQTLTQINPHCLKYVTIHFISMSENIHGLMNCP